jgi:hypothetical protein
MRPKANFLKCILLVRDMPTSVFSIDAQVFQLEICLTAVNKAFFGTHFYNSLALIIYTFL